MNVPPEQIGSGDAGRPGRPRRAAQLHALTSKPAPKGVVEGRRGERVSERGLGQTLQRPLWLMPALICSAAKLSDDVIVDLRAKSAPIQIKVEVLPCTSTERKKKNTLSVWLNPEWLGPAKVLGHLLTLCSDPAGKKKNLLFTFLMEVLEQETIFIWFQQIF